MRDVTTEDDFQYLLDLHPDDHTTRLVFADWLDERADPRAEGYRAMGVLRLHPMMPASREWGFWENRTDPSEFSEPARLPVDWFAALGASSDAFVTLHNDDGTRWWATVRDASDAAALAFARLPAARQAELLAPNPAGA